MIELVRKDAERLDCVEEVEHGRTIISRGTSAHRQRTIYNEIVDGGGSDEEALYTVVDWLIEETVAF